jgi:hypothetical protein
MTHFLTEFPNQQNLLEGYPEPVILPVNCHVHTPYSFSAFTEIAQIFEMARNEQVAVVGINDFFVTDGYGPFYQEALKSGIFPLFNIEFIGLLKQEQQQGIRINDPNNPGRCYFSGKGLDFPFSLEDRLNQRLTNMVAESQDQVRSMIEKVNDWFTAIHAELRFSYDEIRIRYAKNLVRERHIAKAIRMAVFEKVHTDEQRNLLLTTIFGGKTPKSNLHDIPGLENEIRSNLLKTGGKAFVEEDDSTFMNLGEIIETIVRAGGIPCYPVLLDDANGNYTEYEKDPLHLMQELRNRNIGCIELIPGRNDASHLERFIRFFHERNFVIMLGTEHNTPDRLPLTCDTRGKTPLSPEVRRISYEGACVVAAHQYLRAKGMTGFLDGNATPRNGDRDSFVRLGNAIIHHFIQSFIRNKQ